MCKYIVLAILASFAFYTKTFAETDVFRCVTVKHIIIISEPIKGTYHYRSWNKPKAISDKPDMDLKSKEVSVEGTGACRHTEYSFKTGKVEFSLDDDVSCIEGNPPANAVGNLNILVNGELKNHYYCFKQ